MNDDILKVFGDRVRARRKTLGWTQEELAARAEIDRSYIGGVERGTRNATLTMVARICTALESDIPTIMSGGQGQPR